MRIVGGKFKGRKINTLTGVKTRPLQNNIQEAIFNILEDVEDVKVLELFAGFGLFSWECMSRGAKSVTLVEKDRKLVKKLLDTSAMLDVKKNTDVVFRDIFKGLKFKEESFNLIFADPPFYLDLCTKTFELVYNNKWLSRNGLFIIRTFEKEDIKTDIEPVYVKKYGISTVYFYKFD